MESDIITKLSENSYSLYDVPFAGITICSDLQLKNLENRTVKDQMFNKYSLKISMLVCIEIYIFI